MTTYEVRILLETRWPNDWNAIKWFIRAAVAKAGYNEPFWANLPGEVTSMFRGYCDALRGEIWEGILR